MESLNFEKTFIQINQQAQRDGVEVELLVERSEKLATSFQNGKPDKFESSASHCAGFRVLADGYPGYAYTENLSSEALLEAYREALNNARFTAKAEDPSQKMKLAKFSSAVPELPDLFNDSLQKVSLEEKLKRGQLLETRPKELDTRIAAVPYNLYSEVESEVQIYNSQGVHRRQRQTMVAGYSYCLAQQGEEKQMAGEALYTRNACEFDADSVAKRAAEKVLNKLGAIIPATGTYPVVFDSEVASDLFGLITDYFSAKSVSEKNSLFMNDLGQTIASSHLTMIDDPFFKNGLGTRPFDSEGAPSQKTTLIENGKLTNFLTNSVYAERMKLPHTASAARGARSELDIGISNLVVTPGSKSLEELLKAYPKVIYIQELKGFHSGFNDGSGDFSLPAQGELWENGQRIAALKDFVISGNIRQLLKDIVDTSHRVLPPQGAVIAPDVLVRQLSVAGK